MKATFNEEAYQGFQPFSVTITLESQAEAEALFAVFNHAWIVDCIEKYGISSLEIRDAIKQGYAPNGYLDYHSTFTALERFIRKAVEEEG